MDSELILYEPKYEKNKNYKILVEKEFENCKNYNELLNNSILIRDILHFVYKK